MPRRIQCGSCDEVCGKNDEGVECDACKKKFHKSCTNLKDEEYKILTSRTRLKWFCQMCESDVEDILNNFEKFKKVSNEISKIKNEMDTKILEIEKRVASCEETGSKKSVEQAVQEVNRSMEQNSEEKELIESKKRNLVYFNVPESTEDSPADRMKYDFGKLEEAYKNEALAHNDIETLYRVGKRGETNRPLIVKFKNDQTRSRILGSSSKLNIKHDNEVRPIYVSIDRTPKQREEHKKLVEELKGRKRNGETDLVIRNNKIVKNFQANPEVQRITWSSLFKN